MVPNIRDIGVQYDCLAGRRDPIPKPDTGVFRLEAKTVQTRAVHELKDFELEHGLLTKNVHPYEAPKTIADWKPIPAGNPLHKVIDECADENAIFEMVKIRLVQSQLSAEEDEIILARHIRQ